MQIITIRDDELTFYILLYSKHKLFIIKSLE